MKYEIVKFEDESGEVTITRDDVRNTFCRNATEQEIDMFMALCRAHNLDPYKKEVYLVKYGNGPAQMITSRAAFQKRADAHPDYEGTEIGTVIYDANTGQIVRQEGEAYYPMVGQQLIGGWARVHRKGRKPYYTEVALQEYNTGKSNWAKMPGTMICKVAEVHALRGAFPADFAGMYSEEEMAQAVESTSVPTSEVPVEGTYEAPEPSNDELIQQLTEKWVQAGYDMSSTVDWLRSKVQADGRDAAITATDNLVPVSKPDTYQEDIEF